LYPCIIHSIKDGISGEYIFNIVWIVAIYGIIIFIFPISMGITILWNIVNIGWIILNAFLLCEPDF